MVFQQQQALSFITTTFSQATKAKEVVRASNQAKSDINSLPTSIQKLQYIKNHYLQVPQDKRVTYAQNGRQAPSWRQRAVSCSAKIHKCPVFFKEKMSKSPKKSDFWDPTALKIRT